ncbi:MAG TPA: GNAT family N-acetyltransferase [Bacillales bacterium]|nr:GNAT family N-acetyltransferase [Bacillales bacterium]
MEIRRLTPEDAEKHWALRLEALRENPEAFASSYEEAAAKEEPIGEARERLAVEENYSFGAFEEGELIGTVVLVPETKPKLRHKANLFAMYVTPRKRGMGAGRALVEVLVAKARELEAVEQIVLAVESGNEKAKWLYAAAGFQTYGKEPKALKEGGQYFDEEYMVLFL